MKLAAAEGAAELRLTLRVSSSLIKAFLMVLKSKDGLRVRDETKEEYSAGRARIMVMVSRSSSSLRMSKSLERSCLISCMAFSILEVREGRDSLSCLVMERRAL